MDEPDHHFDRRSSISGSARSDAAAAFDHRKICARLAQDLRFLNQVGILSDLLYERLCLAVEPLTPQQVWLGFDYTDPVLKNFVASQEGGKLYAVDVEGIADGQLIGMGTIKACVRWLGEFQPLFYEHLAAQGASDFQPYMPFVELCFLAKWTKRNFFEGKKKKEVVEIFNKKYKNKKLKLLISLIINGKKEIFILNYTVKEILFKLKI